MVMTMSTSDALTSHLTKLGKLSAEQLERARAAARDASEPVEAVLTKLGLVSERDLAAAFASVLDLRIVGLAEMPAEALPISDISIAFLRHYKLLPLTVTEKDIVVAMARPIDDYAREALALFANRTVIRCVATGTEVDAALDRLAPGLHEPEPDGCRYSEDLDVERLRDLASDAPVIRLVNQIIANAVEAGSSDIHIEPMADRLSIRFRVDGMMREVEQPPLRLRDAMISRVKIMARLNIAERRLPQDGRMSFSVRGMEIDFRVSTVPTIHGESIVIRVLDQEQMSLDFEALGFDAESLARYRPILDLPHGIVLVTGPTGSGKTTTLYASLATLNTPDRKIMTIEDPVEYQLPGINQVQVQGAIGLTFAQALRAFLRQNPNIVMVGEIRDLETAQVAIQAALTGHMILSTLHTNDAVKGITRLLDMGVEDYLLIATVNAIVAQRLVRKLCPTCREPYEAQAEFLARLGLPGGEPRTLYRAVGCPECGGSGYRGRTTILEILRMSERLRDLILAHAPASELQSVAIAEGMRTMHEHGVIKALAGITSVEEILRVTREI